jgi:phytoene synthase
MIREQALFQWWRRGTTKSDHLGASYALAHEITREASKSFFLSTLLLPQPKRRAIQALYAFLRTTDNIVDDGGAGATLAALEGWRIRSRRAVADQDHPVLLAWADTRARFGVPQALAEELIDGVAMDLTVTRYDTFDALQRYCYCVASTVGLMSLHIIGSVDGRAETMAEAAPYAAQLGLAMQLTNILRDVGEDARLGRIYLPVDELRGAGYGEDELLTGAITPPFRALLDAQIDRANALYEASLPGIALLHPESRFAIASAASIYRGILPKIVANDYDVFTRRAHLNLREKLMLLPQVRAQRYATRPC